MIIKDISYKKLQLAILDGSIDLSHLNIFQESYNNIPSLGLKIHAGIIGTSHFVQVHHKNSRTFTEIFACDVLDNNKIQPLFFSPIEKIKSDINLNHSWLNYSFEFSRKSYVKSAAEVSKWAKEIQKQKPLTYLEFHFDLEDQSLPSSRTILIVHKTSNGILTQTIHEYQEEDAIIWSESKLNLL